MLDGNFNMLLSKKPRFGIFPEHRRNTIRMFSEPFAKSGTIRGGPGREDLLPVVPKSAGHVLGIRLNTTIVGLNDQLDFPVQR